MRQLATRRALPVLATLLGVIAVAALTTQPARALDADKARSYVETFAERSERILESEALSPKSRRMAARDLIVRTFDIPAIARFVLGPHRARLDDGALADFADLYGVYVMATYLSRLEEAVGETNFEIVRVSDYGDRDQLVDMQVSSERLEGPLNIGWRVRQRDSGPKIIDILLEGVSLAVTQRSEFQSLIGRNGVEGLKQAMRRKIDQVSETETAEN